jgi:hypothetical protein
MNLNVLQINLSPKRIINSPIIDEGSFSYLTGFKIFSKKYALKNIKISIDDP